MEIREKLVEILRKPIFPHELVDPIEAVADYLLDSGVTVQEWISVKDGVPKYTEEEMERYRFFGDTFFPEFNVMILGAIRPTTLYYDGERWYDEESRCYCVTHWQPMPQPPKGE